MARNPTLDNIDKKYGAGASEVYSTWVEIRRRGRKNDWTGKNKCYNGIDVDLDWSFEAFFNEMGLRPSGMSIDRIDSAKGYYSGNCRWASLSEQARNSAKSSLNEVAVLVIRYLYETGMYSQQRLADAYGVSQHLISLIIRRKLWVH